MADEKRKAMALQVFQTLDNDDDGLLQKEDLKEFILEEEKLEEVFAILDRSKSGKISFEDFLEGFDAFGGIDDLDDDLDDDDLENEMKSPVKAPAPVNRRLSVGRKSTARRGSISAKLQIEELSRPRNTLGRRESVQNFEYTKGTTTREARFKKIMDWCVSDEGGEDGVDLSEVEVTVRYLFRAFTDEESSGLVDLLKSNSFSSITLQAFHSILVQLQPGLKEDWSDDKFVNSFLVHFKDALKDPKAGVVDTSHEDQVAQLQSQIRDLQKKQATAEKRYKKLSEHTSALDMENAELRDKVKQQSDQLKNSSSAANDTTASLQTQKAQLEQYKLRQAELEEQVKSATKEHQNDTAMLEAERKLKKTLTADNKVLKETLTAMQSQKSEKNRLELVKKVHKMKAVIKSRQYVRELQVANAKLPELDTENKFLRQKIAKLEEEAKEYLRLMDSFKDAPGAMNQLDLPEDTAPINLAMALNDGEELDAAKRRIAELEALLEEERRKNAELMAQIEALKAELEKERAARAAAEAEVERLKAENAELLAQIEALKAELEKERAARAAAEAEVERLKAELEDVNAKLEEETAKRKALEEELAKAMAELEALRARIKELEELVARLQQELADKETEVVTIIEEKVHIDVPDMSMFASGSTEFKSKAATLKLSAEQQAEVTAYAICLNQHLAKDPDLKHLMPINVETPELLFKIGDGLLLAKFINCAAPETIDERALNLVPEEGDFAVEQILENLNLLLSAGKSIGVSIRAPSEEKESDRVQIASAAQRQLMECTEPDISIDFIYELIKTRYYNHINVRSHPELVEIAENPEIGLSKLELEELKPKELAGLNPEEMLLRWVNFHRIAGATGDLSGFVKNFGADLKDGKDYTAVLGRIAEKKMSDGGMFNTTDTSKTDGQRAKFVLELAKQLGVQHFHRAANITSGSDRLNRLLAAVIFNSHTGLANDSEDVLAVGHGGVGGPDATLGSAMDSDSREERAFRMWVNSAGIPGVFLNNLFLDCRDGLALLKVIDYIEPVVNWKQVEMNPNNKFKGVSNCNYAIKLCKDRPFLASLVGIGGPDIAEGNEKFILSIMWQLMRHHTIKHLQALQGSGSDKIKEEDILEWANAKVKENPHTMNPVEKIRSFKDPALNTGIFLVNMVWSIEPKIIDWKMVTAGETPVEKIRNAGYAISVARKLGAEIFLLPHDIVEVKYKMITLFVASMMSVDKTRNASS
mmetsp:Transcript_21996/g.43713  ORF Transcript_21996/g.43713 Transcript_21996/m.43713 type:complete len:1223 (+) Transcript_21996:35-3703(+)|eukprot:CAMPEP_0175138278 /NCGR_PEP_ID=MMETSP0087-20121206/10261_1 /TAXON_ID=136419 /ORGANISM="Unknown Unknown, Strain D1" /LENGTH=1222 /DNA_ID=CAMNT_0016421165 /DNA_START=30 /DNA_END=3698 /DNA_ORIENTATION=-